VSEKREKREYFRVPVFARVALRALDKEQETAARRHLHARSVEPARAGAADGLASPEARGAIELLRRIALALERIERRLEQRPPAGAPDSEIVYASPGPIEISLSASGFAGRFAFDADPEQLVHVELDLWEAGLPPIVALAHRVPGEGLCAFQFEDIHSEDRERIVQLALRTQSQALRRERSGEQP
jgi:hypothetical protein